MVGLQAMVSGQLGRKPSPHPRACALSCPAPFAGRGSAGLRLCWPRCTDSSSYNAAFALRPLRLAKERLWCDHDYPRWGEHTSSPGKHPGTTPGLGSSASIMGSELSSLLGSGPSHSPVPIPSAPLLNNPVLAAHNTRRCRVRLVLLRRLCGLLFFLYYLQAFELLEGEAHYAAV